MSIKLTAFAAAAITAMGTASLADSSYFSFQDTLDNSQVLELGTVTSAADGVVEIYNFHGGEIGALLGSEEVRAGANKDVRVPVGTPPRLDVIAVLKIDGQTVATRDYDIN